MSAEDQITPEVAQSLLDKDQLNRVSRVTKGGLLSTADRKRLKILAKRRGTSKKELPKVKTIQNKPVSSKSFEGTFTQKQRRFKVYQLRLRRYSSREIAEKLDADRMTILKDLQHIDWALHQTLDASQATPIMNEALLDYEAIRTMALEAVEDADGRDRAVLLAVLTKATEAKVALLQDGGILPKATQRLHLSDPTGKPIPLHSGDTHIHVQITDATKDTPPVVFEVIDMADDEDAAA